jgi:hypothetical protein
MTGSSNSRRRYLSNGNEPDYNNHHIVKDLGVDRDAFKQVVQQLRNNPPGGDYVAPDINGIYSGETTIDDQRAKSNTGEFEGIPHNNVHDAVGVLCGTTTPHWIQFFGYITAILTAFGKVGAPYMVGLHPIISFGLTIN